MNKNTKTSEEDDGAKIIIEEIRTLVNTFLRNKATNSTLWEFIGDKKSDANVNLSRLKRIKNGASMLINSPINLKTFQEAFLFFRQYTAHIEILREDRLHKTYFIILPFCTFLNQQMQDQFHKNCNRASVKSKVTSLMEKSGEILEVLKHEEKLSAVFENTLLLRSITKKIGLWMNITLILTFLQNVLIVYSNKRYTFDSLNPSETLNVASPEYYIELCNANTRTFARFDFWGLLPAKEVDECWCYDDDSTCALPLIVRVMQVIGIIQTSIAALVLIFYLLKVAPLRWRRAQREFLSEDQTAHSPWRRGVRNFIKLLSGLVNIFSEFNVFYYTIFTIITALSMAFISNRDTYYISNFFSSIMLMDLIRRAPLLQHIISAIWRPRMVLLLALILFLVIEYIFSLFAFYNFANDYQGACMTLKICFFVTIDQTFKNDGGVGGYLNYIGTVDPTTDITNPQSLQVDVGRFAFDNLFNFIIGILIVRMISGIIIDTFAVLREEDDAREDDKKNWCFICGFARQQLDKKSDNNKGFAYHIKFEHNLWNYLFYVAYIQNKESTEYTGMETYVADQIEKGEIDWFPLERNADFEGERNAESEETILNRIYQEKLVNLKDSIDNLESKMIGTHTDVNELLK